MIPEGWIDVELGEVATFKGGSGFKERFQGRLSGDLPFIKVSDMNLPGNEEYIHRSQNWVSKGEAKEMRASPMPARSIVFAKVGAALLLNRRRRLIMPTIIDNNMMAAIPNEKRITSDYLFRFLTTIDLGKFAQASAVPSVNQQHLSEILAFLPPIGEQVAINSLLETWDHAIKTVEALIGNARAQKQALMQQLLPQGTTPPKKRLPGFSGEWRGIRLGAAFTERVERGNDLLPLLSVTQANGVIPQGEAGRRNISSEDQSNYKTVCAGDIAYNTMRMWQGASALSALTGKVSPAYTVVTPRKGHYALFYAYLFKQPKMIHVFERHSQGLVSDTWNLKFPLFAKIGICAPDLEEQVAIAEAFKSLDDLSFAYESQLTALREEKAALMQQLLTGKRRVKISESEAA